MKYLSIPVSALVISALLFSACSVKKQNTAENAGADSTNVHQNGFNADVEFLKKYTDIMILQDSTGQSKIAVSPALQGRVMTSTSQGDTGPGYGWINRDAFLSGDTSSHFNAFGGEDRFWLGPEGGQFAIYFAPGKEFSLDNWHVPRLIDLEPFEVAAATPTEIVFTRNAEIVNYSGTPFNIAIERKVRLIDQRHIPDHLGINDATGLSMVAYETINTLKNTGDKPWRKQTGLLSVWILGMFTPSDNTTVIIPYRGKADSVSHVVNDRYFGKVPEHRLKIDDKAVYFSGDGKHRSKIGLSPQRSTEWLGSYDADNGVLTLVKYNKPEGVTDYVNSFWEIQKQPYGGDAVNAYNDGPPSPGVKPMGPFYELETSSPARELEPGQSVTHIHTTFHIKGLPEKLDEIMTNVLGVDSKRVTGMLSR
ncbi:MAG TPA: DUF6786 family protein [Ohtaekwangia sp.]|nr:DUF6786 family protein [Ohtaekwangia sp.]